MANKAGFSMQAVGSMLNHYARTPDESGKYQDYPRKEGGGHIDPDETKNNYSIGECHGESWVSDRLEGVYQRPQDRGRRPVMLDIVVTMPRDEPRENMKDFFQAAYDSLKRQYGGRNNIVGGWVHVDEAQPHLHFAFLPIANKSMKSNPEVKEGISQASYFPKKSSLRDMHETLQQDISQALGHHVSILNGATAAGNKTVAELKERTAKQLEEARVLFRDLKDMRAKIEETKTIPFIGNKVYQMDGETLNGLLRLARAGATAGRLEDERRQAVITANTRAEQADKERAAVVSRLETVNRELEKLSVETKPYMDIPGNIRANVARKIEDVRIKRRDMTDQYCRDICKAFLDNGRDFNRTFNAVSKQLEKLGIPKGEQRKFVKDCLSEVMKQARSISRAAKRGGGWTPPTRGGGWTPKPKETNFFAHLLPDLSNVGVPVSSCQLSYRDWDDLDDEEKERILFLLQM